jgi:hypothetical protein
MSRFPSSFPTLLKRVGLALGAVAVLTAGALIASRPARAVDVKLGEGVAVRMKGKIRGVGPDLTTVEVGVVTTVSESGRTHVFTEPTNTRFKLAEVCFIYHAEDRTVFYGREDLKPGVVCIVVGMQVGEDLVAQEILLGGSLPKPPRIIPGGPDLGGPLYLPKIGAGPARFEPKSGCYLGAFVVNDINVERRMDVWEKVVGKRHASYLTYAGYGQPFPTEWVRSVRSVGAAPNIALEPNGGLSEVRDNAYLRRWARSAAASGGPVFLRFASEMNGAWTAYHGNPWLYRSKFRLVASVMRREAPNVAMVWTPYCLPAGNIPAYYPGDDAVDWVGVNIYSVHHHNGNLEEPADQEDPLELLKPVYDRYAAKKPIQISEYAATNYCQACGQDLPGFAIQKMSRLYRSLPARFPRVKMIYWFSWDTISGGAAENNYAVTGHEEVLAAYRRLTHQTYFLPTIPHQSH